MRLCLCNETWWQCRKKWTLLSTFKLHKKSGLINALKLWLNSWSLRWLKPNRRRVSNFNPVGRWIPYVSLHLCLIKFNGLLWTLSAMTLIETKCRILSKLFHSFTVYEKKNEFLKNLVLILIFRRSESGAVKCSDSLEWSHLNIEVNHWNVFWKNNRDVWPIAWVSFAKSLIHYLTLSWRRPLSYRNQSIDLVCKSMDWFSYMITASVMKELILFKRLQVLRLLLLVLLGIE